MGKSPNRLIKEKYPYLLVKKAFLALTLICVKD